MPSRADRRPEEDIVQLYTAKASPFGRTVEIVAHELGLHEDLEVVATKVTPTDPNVDYQRAVNPLRKIPALKTEEGLVIVDSTVIAEYLCARVGDTRLFARDGADQWAVLSNYALARGAAECAVGARYETAVRPQDKRFDGWVDDQMDKIGATLGHFEANPPAASGRLTIADIALGALLGYLDFRFADYGWRDRFPGLGEWLKPLAARPSFAATAPV